MIKDTSAQDRTLTPPGIPWRRLLGIGLVLLAGLGATGSVVARWFSDEIAINSERLRIAEVTVGNLVRDVSAAGRVVAGVSPTLYAPNAGTVTFRVRPGDHVAQGALLAEIDSPQLTSQLAQERARLQRLDIDVKRQAIEVRMNDLAARKDLQQAAVALDASQREFERNQLAWDRGAISQVDLRRAEDERASARIAHDHAVEDIKLNRAAWDFEQKTRELELQQQALLVEELERLVEGLSVRAPIAGRVGSLLVADKTSVADNAALLSVVDLSQLEVEAQVPEIYADALGPGLSARVRVGNSEHPGTVTSISPEIVQGQVAARIRFDGELPAGLRQNQRLQTRLLLEEHSDTLVLTRGPFLEDGGGRVAYVLRDGYAERRPIETGLTSVSDIEVLSGLEPGDRVVISSLEPFRNAERVRLE
ncbi:efflux RND transporter periplasmic adaptor subunit [Parahaliea mediterranea]|uniref:HlyD family efflux transporter periplasmic adaptor subunit n=1 Tax=Parahaliea mediterranea TaxID=651086 RepID=A0A939DFC5_9GAMM|nr:HlyD family efflux transporter periplasmic adaptor subunit [Parahaliea mediterranea]MBN7796492.1 HlyD family efflux transporter periplasmic adaptor subunit [Parahaliea mediterranea]